ncbi:MAG: VWA domain-containing protein [Desulfatiglans sp.]|nr:VWA domain-containing protein [Thermodesulfobacteriota bacterium]MEE4352875.1 VWA domain-containing protein [Desulfatiglans sp.]
MTVKQPIFDISGDDGRAGLVGWVIRFGDFLKDNGYTLFQSSIHDALQGLQQIDIAKNEDFMATLRATLAKTDLEWSRFDELFNQFWGRFKGDVEQVDNKKEKQPKEGPHETTTISPHPNAEMSDGEIDLHQKEWLEGIAYSPVSMVEKKDLSRFDDADIKTAQLALKRITASFKISPSRRRTRGRRHSDIDFRRVMRKSFKSGGIPMELFYRKRKRRLKKLVVLTDVSGSMDRYIRFVMPLVLGLRGVGPKAEVFAFSTSLARLTFMLHHLTIDQALELIAKDVPDWSGGTKIGFSLHQFTETYGQKLLTRRTVVVILSDGWDLGAKELLRREMALINQKADSVVWLNPLAGNPDYRPVCHGMQVALPYVDYFLPADSLENLKKVARTISGIMST